ncbi:MAG TPA: signal peptidase I [Steroidobacteraceae bacterium]|nr:signal peptidase I [Steroidobacteraceae bacterium]
MIEIALVIALLATGIVWLLDALLWRRQRSGAEPLLVSWSRSFFPVLLIVVLIRSFVFEPFRIPSASMMPGLVDGDFVFVAKYSYGLRLPVLNTRILRTGEPRRGDVIVFRLPRDPSVYFIKRLVGLPGDHIVVSDNRVSINGIEQPQRPDGTYAGGYGFSGARLALERFGAAEHVLMFAPDRLATDFEAVVPEGEYYFMGDNRNDSEDSRFPDVGFVPERNLVGRATRIWFNWQLPDHWPLLGRIGQRIS